MKLSDINSDNITLSKTVSKYDADNLEYAYIDLCKKMNTAQTNHELITIADGFKKLGDYRDCYLKRKQCLDRLAFNNPNELMVLGNCYKELPMCGRVGDRCIEAAKEWNQYETDYKEFFSAYDSKPMLLKLWDKFSTLIIIVGIVTLLWGFIIYFGAVLIEFIVRSIVTAIKRASGKYKEESKALMVRKQEIDAKLAELRNRDYA
ncbi:MAG: hypothetical protein ACI4GY_07390 [Acutalibacteraceae bacterium]